VSGGARAFFAIASRSESGTAGDTFVVDVREGTMALVGPNDALAPSPRAHGVVSWDGARVWLEADHDDAIFAGGKRVDGKVELRPGDDVEAHGHQFVLGLAAPFVQPQRRSFTHAELEERIAEELARAARAWRPTALVMARARHGDGARVLEAALAGLRAGDCVATFAPDEIAMLLPDTTRDRAEMVVARTLAEAGVEGVLVGVAVAPEDAERSERFLRAARLALRATAGLPPPEVRRGLVAEDARTRATLDVLERALREVIARGGARVVIGEPSSGRASLVRAALARIGGDGPFARLPCRRLEATTLATAEAGSLVLLEDVDRLAPELRDTVVHRFATSRVIATAERALDARFGALGLWLGRAAPIEVPPLRQRLDDVVPLAKVLGTAWSGREPRFSAAALARLRSHPWPGNVVELEVAMERATLLAGEGEIQAEHLPGDAMRAPAEGRLREHVDSVERDVILRALAESNHNQTSAARKLGLSRRSLIYKMEKYGLKPPPTSAARGRRA
jgi:transcriptional regulator of acetoin/glycerol metabolism